MHEGCVRVLRRGALAKASELPPPPFSCRAKSPAGPFVSHSLTHHRPSPTPVHGHRLVRSFLSRAPAGTVSRPVSPPDFSQSSHLSSDSHHGNVQSNCVQNPTSQTVQNKVHFKTCMTTKLPHVSSPPLLTQSQHHSHKSCRPPSKLQIPM